MAAEEVKRVGEYEVLALIGSGGMGRVYKVRNIISNREEAMKILLPDFAKDPELAARFMAEIRTLAGLEHPNIAQLRTAFQVENQFVMVMEYVEGTSLDKLAPQLQGSLDTVLDYAMQVLAALSYAHGRGVTHRDIKPANIMITSHGVVKLMDFGIAKSTTDMNLTRPGTTMGSIYYMSPEQVRGGTVDARSDIYSFGITLYEMLTGRKPFEAETSYTVLNAQVNEMPTAPAQVNAAIPMSLSGIVMHAMAKNPAERFQTAEEFRRALDGLRTKPSVAAAVQQPAASAETLPVATPIAQAAQNGQQAGFAPVAVVGAPTLKAKSHRALWVTVGALATVLLLVAAGLALPRFYRMFAAQKSGGSGGSAQAQNTPGQGTPSQGTPSESAPVPAATSMEPPPPAAEMEPPAPMKGGDMQRSMASNQGPDSQSMRNQTPGGANRGSGGGQKEFVPGGAGPAPPGGKSQMDGGARGSGAQGSQTPAAPGGQGSAGPVPPTVPVGPSAQEIRQAHDRFSNLDARAQAASAGVQQLRSQQQAEGLDIRGDILASMNRMSNDMRDADQAMGKNDLATANDYMDRAEREVKTLEKFLGR